jgi:hypothetical protein
MFSLPEGSPVPPEYIGVWKRTLLRTPSIKDTTTQVYWMQTASWHADIRIPADRARRAGKLSLGDMMRDELLGLARQQGFCGTTEVDGDICRWQRRHDFQPPSGRNDIGRMVFESPDRVLEYGVEADYFEIWERLPGSAEDNFAHGTTGQPVEFVFGAGDYRMRVVPRKTLLPDSPSFSALASEAQDDVLRGMLDFEISFGKRTGPVTWKIALSTLPWREGEDVRV